MAHSSKIVRLTLFRSTGYASPTSLDLYRARSACRESTPSTENRVAKRARMARESFNCAFYFVSFVAVLVFVCLPGAHAATECPAVYKSEPQIWRGQPQPLLLGGVHSGCLEGCQTRDDAWGPICAADPDTLATINVCEEAQRPGLLQAAVAFTDGDVWSFSPCELHGLLENRTLWLVGYAYALALAGRQAFRLSSYQHSPMRRICGTTRGGGA